MMLNQRQFGGQLPLFVSGQDLVALRAGDAMSTAESGETFADKLEESKQKGLYASIARTGVREPVEVSLDADPGFRENDGEPMVYSGHHRAASAADLGQEYVPVLFHETVGDVFERREKWEPFDSAYPPDRIDGPGTGEWEED